MRGRSGSSRKALGAAVAVLTAHNLIQNSIFNERGYVVSNLLVTAGLVGLARSQGLSLDEIGIAPGDLPKTGVVAAGMASAGVAVVLASRRSPRPLLSDRRAVSGSSAEVARRALVRFPLGTALFEEVAFRGVLPELLERAGSTRPDAMSAVLFGLWHIIPTRHALRINKVVEGRRRVILTILGSAAAGLGGYVLSLVRRSTGSVLAPWVIHATTNSAAYLASVGGDGKLSRSVRGGPEVSM